MTIAANPIYRIEQARLKLDQAAYEEGLYIERRGESQRSRRYSPETRERLNEARDRLSEARAEHKAALEELSTDRATIAKQAAELVEAYATISHLEADKQKYFDAWLIAIGDKIDEIAAAK